jgi:hypothetical protein
VSYPSFHRKINFAQKYFIGGWPNDQQNLYSLHKGPGPTPLKDFFKINTDILYALHKSELEQMLGSSDPGSLKNNYLTSKSYFGKYNPAKSHSIPLLDTQLVIPPTPTFFPPTTSPLLQQPSDPPQQPHDPPNNHPIPPFNHPIPPNNHTIPPNNHSPVLYSHE